MQWNHVDQTLQLFNDLAPFVSSRIRLAVCDNGSEPECWEMLKNGVSQRYSSIASSGAGSDWKIALLRNQNNSGFAAGINSAIRSLLDTDAEWLWLLNNDIRIDAQALKQLLARLNQIQPGVYGTMMEEGGMVRAGVNKYNRWTTRYRPVQQREARKILDGNNVYINGASIVLHREVVENIGLLSEETFLYFEELDYARRLAGSRYRQGLIGQVTVQHTGAGSSSSPGFGSKRLYHETWSTLAFYRQHHPALYYAMLLLRTPARIATLVLRGRASETGAVARATGDFVKGINRDKQPVRIIEERYFC